MSMLQYHSISQWSRSVELASGIILTTGDGGDDTVSGVVSGAGSLTKAGSGL